MVFLPLMLIWLRDPMYFNAPSRWVMVAFAASIGLLAPELSSDKPGNAAMAADFGQSSPGDNSFASAPQAESDYSSLIREGTRLTNRVGRFSRTDEGWYFTADQADFVNNPLKTPGSSGQAGATANPKRPSTAPRIRVLENLALQRVAQLMQQDLSDNRWIINGVVTEFLGENRLLVVLAVRAPIEQQSQR
jgi:hypothetical protein